MVRGTGRPEDDVACPACGKEPGDSCDGPASHPSRLAAHAARAERVTLPAPEEKGWVINDVRITNRCGFCGEEFGVRHKHVCASAAIDPVRGTMLTTVDAPAAPAAAACPTCRSSTRELPLIVRGALRFRGRDQRWCQDAWHFGATTSTSAVVVHAPRIARTLADGPDNRTLVRGCACGAEVTSAETYADHVGWPIEAVRALLNLVGIADDLYVHREETLSRPELWREIMSCLEVRR